MEIQSNYYSVDTPLTWAFYIIPVTGLMSLIHWAAFYKIRNESKLLNFSLLWQIKTAFYSIFPISFYILKYILAEDSEPTVPSIVYLILSPFVIYFGFKLIFYKNLLLVHSTKNKLKRVAYIIAKDISVIFFNLFIWFLLIFFIQILFPSVYYLTMPIFTSVLIFVFMSLSFLLGVEYSKKELFLAVLYPSLVHYTMYAIEYEKIISETMSSLSR